MPSNTIAQTTLRIGGMTCAACESRIERALRGTQGVVSAKASYRSGTADIRYDEGQVAPESLKKRIEQLGYTVKKQGEADPKANIGRLLGVAAIALAACMLLSRFGGLEIFNAFPEALEGMGYGMLFVIGLLTSVHCIAMCGGINLSQCVPQVAAAEGKLAALRPSLLYNLGRVISYTFVGGVVGALGSVVSFSGAAKGVVPLVAGAFMVIMGLNMLDIFPWLKRLNPRMPRIFTKRMRAPGRGRGPLYIGLLNGLMPCGPLQAMQLYALSTASAFSGALSMLLFSLGTVPLMFGLGALGSILSKKFTRRMMTASAVLVVVLGVFMFGSGMSLSGFALPAAGGAQGGNAAVVKGGVQTVTTALASGRYEPITVQKGIPVRWTIQAQARDINGCNNRIIISAYGKEVRLQPGDNVIEFTPQESGTLPYSCWMGMIRSRITVVDDLAEAGESPAPDGIAAGYAIPTDDIAVARIEGDAQYVRISVGADGFSPAVVVVQRELETQWTIDAVELTDGNSTLLFPLYSALLDLEEGENPIFVIPDTDFDFQTGDGALFGYVKVVDDLSDIDLDAIRREVERYEPSDWNIDWDDVGAPRCH